MANETTPDQDFPYGDSEFLKEMNVPLETPIGKFLYMHELSFRHIGYLLDSVDSNLDTARFALVEKVLGKPLILKSENWGRDVDSRLRLVQIDVSLESSLYLLSYRLRSFISKIYGEDYLLRHRDEDENKFEQKLEQISVSQEDLVKPVGLSPENFRKWTFATGVMCLAQKQLDSGKDLDMLKPEFRILLQKGAKYKTRMDTRCQKLALNAMNISDIDELKALATEYLNG